VTCGPLPTTISTTPSPSRSATDLRRVNTARILIGLRELLAGRIEHEQRVISGDELVAAVVVEIGDDRRSVPAGFAGQVFPEGRRRDRARVRVRTRIALGGAARRCPSCRR
jgi:hypothetical protein